MSDVICMCGSKVIYFIAARENNLHSLLQMRSLYIRFVELLQICKKLSGEDDWI